MIIFRDIKSIEYYIEIILKGKTNMSRAGKHSSSELEIRYAVIDRIRNILPQARIIEEFAMAGSRADIAAITEEQIIFFEIKSSRDKLDRLTSQINDFTNSSHETILVLDEKWFDKKPYSNGNKRFVFDKSQYLSGHYNNLRIWAYPEDIAKNTPTCAMYSWDITNLEKMNPPGNRYMIWLLWKDEMIEMAHRQNISLKKKHNMSQCVEILNWELPAKTIIKEVCFLLRKRQFAQADPPV